MNVLVVDTNPYFTNTFSYILHDTFNNNLKNILVAESGNEALTILNEKSVDIVFLDVDLPLQQGVELTKKMKSIKKNIQIIAISFFEESIFKNSIINAGAKDYIVKDNISSVVLLKLIENVQC